PRLRLAWPAHGHWLVRAEVVEIGLRTREGHAVVRGDNEQRVVELARRFERLERRAQVTVEPLDLGVIIQYVAAHLGGVGQVWRHYNLFRLHPGLHASVLVIRAVRVVRAKPEAERFACWHLLEELVETFELRPRRVARATARLKIARPPAFARVADKV